MRSSGSVAGDLIRFGDEFELDLRAYELRRAGQCVKLERIPLELLRLLLERRGELVTREQIVERIWGKEVFVDTDNSINAAIHKVRQVLGDDSSQPRFVQTVTGMGYRFIAAIHPEPDSEEMADEAPTTNLDINSVQHDPVPLTTRAAGRRWIAVSVIALALLAGTIFYFQRTRRDLPLSTTRGRVMVAVLPFENLTGDAGQDYLSDGLTEEMIAELGRLEASRIGVIGRTSAMHYRHTTEALDQIGRELGVQYVLEGSVRRDANRIRINAQLTRVQDQTRLWSTQYDRELKDLLVLQEEIARKISGEIEIALGNRNQTQPTVQTPLSTEKYEAYELYLKGQYFWNERSVEGFQKAIDYFEQAITKDPNYARAYAGLADSYALIGGYSGMPQNEYLPRARAAALRAIELDDSLAEAHTARALILQNYDFDWQNSEKEYLRAIELNPNYATGHHWYAEHLALVGRFDEALQESERAGLLDPLSLIIASDRGVIFYYSRHFDRAIAQFLAVREMDPAFPRTSMLRQVYGQKGMFTEVLDEDENWRKVHGDAFWIDLEEAYVYGRTGQAARARQLIAKVYSRNKSEVVDPGAFVAPYIALDDKEQAFFWLEKAYSQRSNFITSLKVNPVYDPLRSDARFQELLKRVGLPQ
jgi:TolB-like protein/DNA-binding winged helix-turn-helix (wHTH) protein/Tfp pilus assembly protein PilF